MVLDTIDTQLGQQLPLYESRWWMSAGERLAMLGLLGLVKPRISIEVGTLYGGSLSILSAHSERVYSLDIDPTVPERMKPFSNVDYIIGDSAQTLPALLKRLAEAGEGPDFALIDGDHSARGIQQDCNSFLNIPITRPLSIVMHDSFNPNLRRGLAQVDWAASPYVHAVYLDWIQGERQRKNRWRTEMWGGLALAVLCPQVRQGPLQIEQVPRLPFWVAWMLSAHNPLVLRSAQLIWLYPSSKHPLAYLRRALSGKNKES